MGHTRMMFVILGFVLEIAILKSTFKYLFILIKASSDYSGTEENFILKGNHDLNFHRILPMLIEMSEEYVIESIKLERDSACLSADYVFHLRSLR